MAQANVVPATVSVPKSLTSTLQSLGRGARDYATETTNDWRAVVAYVLNVAKCKIGETTVDGYDESRFTAARAIFVAAYTEGMAQVSAADVKAGKGTQTEADTWDTGKRQARASFGMGTNRIFAELGFARPGKQNGGGRRSRTPTTPATVETTATLPVTFLADMSAHKDALGAFQVHFGAKLPKAGKDALGAMVAGFDKCMVAILPTEPKAPEGAKS